MKNTRIRTDRTTNLSNLVKSTLLSVLQHQPPPLPVAAANRLVAHASTDQEQRGLLGDILIASHVPWKEETLLLIDEVWKEEAEQRSTVGLRDIPVQYETPTAGSTRLSVWRGDITTLAVDAIVNAANEAGLGCFIPHHKCIDNVIHRRAGPRLRLACQQAMEQRSDGPASLTTGSRPLITPGFALPAQYVIHVTGPQITQSGTNSGVSPPSPAAVTPTQQRNLAAAYWLSLDLAAKHGVRSIAFPCISTGLFGFPAHEAASIASNTVWQWIAQHPGKIDSIIFDVFTDQDQEIYLNNLSQLTQAQNGSPSNDQQEPHQPPLVSSTNHVKFQLAKAWIEKADAVLVVAGAGMSVKEGEMVYVEPDDFTKHYPWEWLSQHGYKTSYQCMGLMGDPNIPPTAKWALNAKHMDNQRWKFTPNNGYDDLKELIGSKDYFVWTSNVDGCFERAGFDASKIYTPQGEWTYTQCTKPCRSDAVFPTRPILDEILPFVSKDGYLAAEKIPKCLYCGGDMFGNVRGGQWFLHTKYEEQSQRLGWWMESLVRDGKSHVVVIEVGAGFNTPTVTRFPAESFVRELGQQNRGTLIRINPSDPEVPADIKAIAVNEGWQSLGQIARSSGHVQDVASVAEELESMVAKIQADHSLTYAEQYAHQIKKNFGHDDWRVFLNQLRDY